MVEAKPTWIKMKPEELEKLVIDLAKKGEPPSKIGIILRDKHGIPKSKLLGKKITKILETSGTEYATEKSLVEQKIEKLKTHIKANKHDYPSQRSLTKNLWAMHKLQKLEQKQ
jgi:small subunit ribosomal protein S15